MRSTTEEELAKDLKNALYNSGLLACSLPSLENLRFRVYHDEPKMTCIDFPRDLFGWNASPPTRLRHLTLDGCYGGPIVALRNLTSLHLTGNTKRDSGYLKLTPQSFLPFISGNPSLVSLTLCHCDLVDFSSSRVTVTPVELTKLKTFRLMDVYPLSSLAVFIEVPAFKTLSSLRVSTMINGYGPGIGICAENNDGFQLFHGGTDDYWFLSNWLDLTCKADPNITFTRIEGNYPSVNGGGGAEFSPLPLFVNAKVVEISASFAGPWYDDFRKNMENIGPQLTTLRLEVVERMFPGVATSVEEFAKARMDKGMPLAKLERMEFEEMSEEDEEKAKGLWDKFWAGLNIEPYLLSSDRDV